MSFSYGMGSNLPIDGPRFLVADTVQFKPDNVTRAYIFEDEEITMVAGMNAFAVISPSGGGQSTTTSPSSPFYVAATLLESLASNKARLASIQELLDVKLSPEKAAQELRAQAEALRNSERNSGAFAIIEQCNDQFAARERLWKSLLRLQA